MIAALQQIVVPVLREHGFSGSIPHFRRFTSSKIHTLTFQFNKWGGSFVVEIETAPLDGITNPVWSKNSICLNPITVAG
jgi:hypothetical protein